MASKMVNRMLLNRDTMYLLSFEDFQRLFPARLRSLEEVRFLFKAIKEKQKDKCKKVKRNTKEYLSDMQQNTSQEAHPDFVLKVMELLDEDLEKESKVFDEMIKDVEYAVDSYLEYCKAQFDAISQPTIELQDKVSADQKELRSHLEMLR